MLTDITSLSDTEAEVAAVDINTFAKKIAELLIQINKTQRAKYNVNVQGGSKIESLGIFDGTSSINK